MAGPTVTDRITWVECPRDAWQGLATRIPTADKARHLNGLLEAGFDHLDAGSFVSPKAVPQMSDTEEVLELLKPAAEGTDVLCIIGNERGLERAVMAPRVTSVGYPLSVNDTFQRRNVGVGVMESWPLVQRMLGLATGAGLSLVVYVSMGFGNPYGEVWSPAQTASAVARLRQMGVTRIALADTVGNADARTVAEVLSEVANPETLGLHLHARPGEWQPQIDAALATGVRWFEGALGGVGGCPFASDELVGNLATDEVLPYLEACGLAVKPDMTALPRLAAEARSLARAAQA